jgi:hypothetical protein
MWEFTGAPVAARSVRMGAPAGVSISQLERLDH